MFTDPQGFAIHHSKWEINRLPVPTVARLRSISLVEIYLSLDRRALSTTHSEHTDFVFRIIGPENKINPQGVLRVLDDTCVIERIIVII